MAKATSKIASLPSQRQHMETRFVALMTELFQLDEAEALGFGLYRVIRRHNREVKAFLGEIISENESKALQGVMAKGAPATSNQLARTPSFIGRPRTWGLS